MYPRPPTPFIHVSLDEVEAENVTPALTALEVAAGVALMLRPVSFLNLYSS